MSDEKQQPRSAPARRHHPVLGALDRLALGLLGPPERQTSPQPVIHRHDSLEDEIDNQLRAINVETDAQGHHYAVRRIAPKPVTPNPGVIYPYYSGRPPLNAPEA